MYETVNSELEKKFKINDYPLNLAIEVTNHCNLNCIMCNNNRMTRPKGFMPIATYKKIVDETAAESPGTRIYFDFYGEALIAGWKLYFLIDYAKKKGLTNVCINTNGTLMNKEFADMLLDSDIDFISFDCDGFSKGVFESIRVNADRDTFFKNVEYLLAEKKRRKTHTIVEVKAIKLTQNQHEIDAIVDHWRSKGAWTTVRRCISWRGKNFSSPLGGDMSASQDNRVACGRCFGSMAITWDGVATDCPCDYDAAMRRGNVTEESIKSIWKRHNESFVKLHIEHQWDQLPLLCRECLNWKIIGEQRYDEHGTPVEKKYGLQDKIYESLRICEDNNVIQRK